MSVSLSVLSYDSETTRVEVINKIEIALLPAKVLKFARVLIAFL